MANELATLEDLMFKKGRSQKNFSSLEDVMFSPSKTALIPTAIKAERAIFRKPTALEVAIPPLRGLSALNQGFQRAEASLAEPLLTGLRKKFPVFGETLPPNTGLTRGLKGESFSPRRFGEQAQFGDVIKEGGRRIFGVNVPDPVADLGGLAAVTALTAGVGPALKFGSRAATIPIKASQQGARRVSIGMAKNILKPTGKFAKRGEQIAESALEQGVLRSSVKKTAEKAQTRIDDLMDQVDEMASKSNITSDLKMAFRSAAANARYWIRQGKPDRAEKILNEVTNIAKAKGLYPGKKMSVKGILNLRRSEDEALKMLKPGGGFWSETIPADIEGRQAFTRGLRQTLSHAVPEIGEKNRAISNLINVKNVAEKRGTVSGRNEPLSLVDYLLLATKAPLFIGKKAYQMAKAPIARTLYGYSKLGTKQGKTIPSAPLRFGQGKIASAPSKMLLGSKTPKLLGVSRSVGEDFITLTTEEANSLRNTPAFQKLSVSERMKLMKPGVERTEINLRELEKNQDLKEFLDRIKNRFRGKITF